jgi:hypothetical protein
MVAWRRFHRPGTRVVMVAIRRWDWNCRPDADANRTITLALRAHEALTRRGLRGRTDLDQRLAHRLGIVRSDHVRPLDCRPAIERAPLLSPRILQELPYARH